MPETFRDRLLPVATVNGGDTLFLSLLNGEVFYYFHEEDSFTRIDDSFSSIVKNSSMTTATPNQIDAANCSGCHEPCFRPPPFHPPRMARAMLMSAAALTLRAACGSLSCSARFRSS